MPGKMPWTVGEGDVPDELLNIENFQHKDRKVLSLINIPLWNRAEWQATGYIYDPTIQPFLLLCFKDIEAAKLIFQDWGGKFGHIDADAQLRISIITGIDKDAPHSYKVLISINPTLAQTSDARHFVLVARINRMDPVNSFHLTSFLERYEATGKYVLVPAAIATNFDVQEPLWDLGILKKDLRVCPAWQIGEHDPDVMAIEPGANPIIPNGGENPPVASALSRFDRRRARKTGPTS